MCFLCSKPEVVQYFNNLIYEATTYHFIALSLNQSDYFEREKEDLATELEERISRNLELAAKECPCELLHDVDCGMYPYDTQFLSISYMYILR